MLNSAANRSRTGRQASGFADQPVEDVEFTMEDLVPFPNGEDFSATATAKNTSDATRTIWMKICSATQYYTGVMADRIKTVDMDVTLEPGEEKRFTMPVSYAEYFDKLVEYGIIRVFTVCHVKETDQFWFREDTMQVKKPTLDIELPSSATVGQSMLVKLSFRNPLNRALTRCSVVVDGPGLTRPKTIQLGDVAAESEMRYELKVFPKRGGRRTIIATFNSKELVDITGSQNIDVIEA